MRLPQTGLAREAWLVSTKSATARFFKSYRDIPENVWEEFLGHQWKNHQFAQIVESTLDADFNFFHVLLTDSAEEIVGLQTGFITRQDLALGFPGFFQRSLIAIRRFFPAFLRPRMMFIGSPAACGSLGKTAHTSLLAESVLAYARNQKVSLLTFKEFPEKDRTNLESLGSVGFTSIASYPAVAMELGFKDFEDYLSTKVGKSTRKSLRRKFRSLEEQAPIRMELATSIIPHLQRIQELYLQVFARAEEKFEKLTSAFFAAVSEQLIDRARFFLWWQGETLIAFSLCFVHDGVFYDDYIGMDDAFAQELHLYYVTFRDQLEWALAQGLRRYYSTPMSYEPKLHLGFQLVPLDLYVRHTSPAFNRIYGWLAKAFAPTVNDPVLKLFPNYSAVNPDSESC